MEKKLNAKLKYYVYQWRKETQFKGNRGSAGDHDSIACRDGCCQQLVEPVASLVVPILVSVEEGTIHYTSNALPMKLIDDVNQSMHQFLVIKAECCLYIIFPDLDKTYVQVGKVALL